ncbi:MAG: apolipoprotein N-acyltransferase [Anaerolineales bacterium]|nr:apolipoprotein N-acyltransferase [Anaerolineales bacterium]
MSTQKHSKSNTFTRVVIGLLLSLLSGVMLTAAFAPYNMWPLVFVAFLPMIAAQYRVFPAKVSSLGGATMIGAWVFMYFGPTFFWGGFMLALPAVVFVINFFTEKGARKFHANTGYRWFIISGVTNWVGFEIARTFIPGIATWGFVNYTLWSQTWLIQPVSIFGIYGLSLLIMLINYALGQALLAWIDRRWTFDAAPQIPARFIRRWLVGVGVACALWVGISLVQYSQAPENPETVRVAAIQLGETEVAFSHPDMDAQERLALLTDLTHQAADQGAELISWSELVLPFDPREEYTAELKALAAETGATLVLPYGVFEEDGLRNEVVILSPAGEFSDAYAKAHPVLFAGEPYGLNVGTFPVYESAYGTIASIICYDLNYTDVTRKMAAQGAKIIVAPSSDWDGIAEKQNIHLVFRAIETRAGIVNAEKAFNSAIVDPYGHILEQTADPIPSQAILVADLPLGTADSLYIQLGDWLGWLALAGMAFFTFFSGSLEKKAHKQNKK